MPLYKLNATEFNDTDPQKATVYCTQGADPTLQNLEIATKIVADILRDVLVNIMVGTADTLAAAARKSGLAAIAEIVNVVGIIISGGELLAGGIAALDRLLSTPDAWDTLRQMTARMSAFRAKQAAAQLAAKAEQAALSLGTQIGQEVAQLSGGKLAALASKVSQAGLSQQEAVLATEQAAKTAFGQVGGTAPLGDDMIVLPKMIDPGKASPIFIVSPSGQVSAALAEIAIGPDGLIITIKNTL